MHNSLWNASAVTFLFLTSSKLKHLYMAIRWSPKMERIRVSGLNSNRRSSKSLQSCGSWPASSGSMINLFVLLAGELDGLLMEGIFIKPMLSISSYGRPLDGDVLFMIILGRMFNVGYCKRSQQTEVKKLIETTKFLNRDSLNSFAAIVILHRLWRISESAFDMLEARQLTFRN